MWDLATIIAMNDPKNAVAFNIPTAAWSHPGGTLMGQNHQGVLSEPALPVAKTQQPKI